jgi:hypothetical protein
VPRADEIKYIILNTGDRLEGVRAEEEGAAYVYGHPIERDNPIQTLFFIPGEVGTINVDKLIKQTQKRLQRVFDDMRKSFADVLANMKKAITPKGTFDPLYSHLGGTPYVVDDMQNALATEFMKSAIASVEAVSNAMNAYYIVEYQTILQVGTLDKSTYLNKINDAYKMWNARAGLYAPSTTSILGKSGNIIHTHPIITLAKGVRIETGKLLAGKTAKGGLEGSFAIFYAYALEAIRNRNGTSLQSRTPMWAGGPPPPPPPAPPAAAAPPADSQATVQAGVGAIDGIFDSLATKSRYKSVIRSADAMFKDVMSTPRSADTTDALNAFSCYLNKRNSCRFDVEAKYELPTPEEIAAISREVRLRGGTQAQQQRPTGKTTTMDVEESDTIERIKQHLARREPLPEGHQRVIFTGIPPNQQRPIFTGIPPNQQHPIFTGKQPEAHSDTFSIPAYFAHLEKAYFETSKTGVSNLAEVQIDIVSEFTGPLALFASYMNVSIKKAVAIFLNVNKINCIDETLYESIEDDLRFCMFDSLPAKATENTQETVENSEGSRKREAQGDAGPQRKKPRLAGHRAAANTSNPPGGRRTFRRRLPKLL